MRRNWRRLTVAILVLLAIGSGTVVVFRAATGGPAVSAIASRWLDRRVEIEDVQLDLGRRLSVELVNVRVYEDATGSKPPVLEIANALGEHRWPWLIAGQLFPRDWTLDRPTLRISADASGSEEALDLPPLGLVVRDGTIELDVAGTGRFRIADLALDAQRSGIPARMTGHAVGVLHFDESELGRFDAEIDGELDDLTAAVDLENVALASWPLGNDAKPEGTANGKLRVGYQPGALRVYLDAVIDQFKLAHPQLRRPLAPAQTRIDASASWSSGTLAVQARRIALDDLVISGTLRVETEDRRLRADLRLAPFEPGRPAGKRLNLLSLLGHRFKTWERVHGRVDAGRVEDFRLRLDLPLDELGPSLAFRRKLRAANFQLTARVSDGIYRPSPQSEPLEGMAGEVAIVGNRLELRGVRMWRNAKPLPELDIVVDGMHRLAHLPADERRPPRGAGVPTPGLGAALRALSTGSAAKGPPVEIHATRFSLGYPAFVLPLRDAEAKITFPDGTVRIREGRGVLGGVPARFQVRFDPKAQRVEANVTYLDGDAPPRRDPGRVWLNGRISIPRLSLGEWKLEAVKGRIEAKGTRVKLANITGRFSDGALEVDGGLSLAAEGHAPYALDIEVTNADLEGTNAPLRFPSGSLTGRADAKGSIVGRLQPDARFLDFARVEFDVSARNGAVSNLPAFIALARLPSLQGVVGLFGRPLPFDELDASFVIKDGTVRSEDLSLVGPELRVLCAGEIELSAPDKPGDVVVAFLFLETVDRVIEKLPVVGKWVLGDNKSLVALYVQLRGPINNPSASLVAPSALTTAAGWAGKMIDMGTTQLRKLMVLRKFPGQESAPPPVQEGAAGGPSPG